MFVADESSRLAQGPPRRGGARCARRRGHPRPGRRRRRRAPVRLPPHRLALPALATAVTPAGSYRPGDHPSVAGTVPHVQVRPSAGRLLSSQLWDVIVTTRPALSLSAVARLWTDEM